MATQNLESFSKPMPPRTNSKNKKIVPPGSPTWRFQGRGPPKKALPKVNNNHTRSTSKPSTISTIDNNGAPPLQMSYTQPVEDNPSSHLKKSASANDVNNYMPVLSTSVTSNTSNTSKYINKKQSPLPSLPSLPIINANKAMDNNNNMTHSPIIPNSPSSITSQLINQNEINNEITPTPPLKEDDDNNDNDDNDDPDSKINTLKDEIKDLENLLYSKRKQLIELEKNKLYNKIENMKPISLLKNFISFTSIANDKELDLIQEILHR